MKAIRGRGREERGSLTSIWNYSKTTAGKEELSDKMKVINLKVMLSYQLLKRTKNPKC